MNGKWYYSVQTEDEMYHTMANMTKEEYIKTEEMNKKLRQAREEEDRKKAIELKNSIMQEDFPRWTEGFKQFYDEKNYDECVKFINESFEDNSSLWIVKYYKRHFDLAFDILTASKEGDKEAAQKKYIVIGKDYEDRLRSTAYEVIRHSPYVESVLDAVEKDVQTWFRNDKGETDKYMQELKDLIEKHKKQIIMEEEQPGGPN